MPADETIAWGKSSVDVAAKAKAKAGYWEPKSSIYVATHAAYVEA